MTLTAACATKRLICRARDGLAPGKHRETASLGRVPEQPIRAPHASFLLSQKRRAATLMPLLGQTVRLEMKTQQACECLDVEMPASSMCCIPVDDAGLGILWPAQWLFEETERVELPSWERKQIGSDTIYPRIARYLPVAFLQTV